MSLKDWIKPQIFLGIAAFLIAWHSYDAVRSEIKQDRSLQFVQQYFTEGMVSQHLDLTKILQEATEEAVKSSDKNLAYSKAIFNNLSKEPAAVKILYYHIHFFEMVLSCMEKLCEPDMIEKNILNNRIRHIFMGFLPYICQDDTALPLIKKRIFGSIDGFKKDCEKI